MYSVIATIILILIILSPIGLIILFRKSKKNWEKKSDEDKNKQAINGFTLALFIVGVGLAKYFHVDTLTAIIVAVIASATISYIYRKFFSKKAISNEGL